MTIKDYMDKTTDILEKMENYDSEGFANQLYYWVQDLNFFYSQLVSNQGKDDPSKVFYQVKPAQRPKEGQVAYFNLRRGYPKETYDGHYCYILKDFGFKYVVIPTTSVKTNSSLINEHFEIDIHLKDFPNDLITRMQVTDIRVVDLQRLNEKRKIFEVLDDQSTIKEKIKKNLFN